MSSLECLCVSWVHWEESYGPNQPFYSFVAQQKRKTEKEIIVSIKHDCVTNSEERYAVQT